MKTEWIQLSGLITELRVQMDFNFITWPLVVHTG